VYSPVGLQGWEIVAASGLFAVGVLTVATVISSALAYLAFREKVPAHRPVVAPTERPAALPQPELAPAVG
jgi:hypothetical protein